VPDQCGILPYTLGRATLMLIRGAPRTGSPGRRSCGNPPKWLFSLPLFPRHGDRHGRQLFD
jgi:hypothetical protein